MKQFHILPWCLIAVLLAAAFALKFVFWGYSFSALVCCCLAGILAFYEITGMLLPTFPAVIPIVRRVFTVCLVIGIAVVSITEGIIIKASFGNPEETVDYVVVLGAKTRVTGPSASLWDRIYAAYDYLEAHPDVTAVVSGGKGDDEPMAEALSMRDELVALGIDPERIWVEDQATSTWENLHFSLISSSSAPEHAPRSWACCPANTTSTGPAFSPKPAVWNSLASRPGPAGSVR